MASRSQGITVEIGGGTTKLSKALEGVNKSIKGMLSTSAGFVYTVERFEKYFSDFAASTASRICIPAAFIPLPCRRSIGAIGADTSISTAIWMPPNRSTMTF